MIIHSTHIYKKNRNKKINTITIFIYITYVLCNNILIRDFIKFSYEKKLTI